MAVESSSTPGAAPDIQDIRDQLDRLLVSSHFRNSKRYPALLRFVVEQAVEGKAGHLKERTIGVEVFARSVDYDPSSDPVVRITAAEVRKRLAQYYQERPHSGEVRIEIPVGSYVPEFRQLVPPPLAPAAVPVPAPRPRLRMAWFPIVAVACVVISVAAVWAEFRHPSSVEQFWAPAIASEREILVCVGGSFPPPPPEAPRRVAWSDTLTLAQLSGFLAARGLVVRPSWEGETSYTDFQAKPAVLIGGLNNAWTLRLMENLRFQFRSGNGVYWIADRDRPEMRDWSVPAPDPEHRYAGLNRDFAIISRIHNPRTGEVTITVAGLRGPGTIAAGKFLMQSASFQQAVKKLPADWYKRNVQLVIDTEVIDSNPGPSRVLANAVW
ncbi:MAG: hypothetical protein ABSH56_24460 [Bryobacteraceae bacterium]